MRLIQLKPAKPLIQLLIVTLAIGIVQSLLLLLPQQSAWLVTRDQWRSGLYLVWAVMLGCGLLIALIDYFRARRTPQISFERHCQDTVSLHRWATMVLNITHQFGTKQQIKLKDLTPSTVQMSVEELDVELIPNRSTQVQYQLRSLERGDAQIAGIEIQQQSPFKLWSSVWRDPCDITLKIYPDFKAIAGYQLMATDNQTSQMGIKQNQRRGEGLEFHQLREYQRGDTSRQIDWKATARKQKLVSREYQDERDQQIVFLLDNGRRMRNKDDDLSHLDHSVNAMTLLSYIALRQGDAVGLMGLGPNKRWLPCKKGSDHINTILNHVYDLQPGIHAVDYSNGAKRLLSLQQRRSLVILVTNTRDEDIDDLLPAIKLISRKHLIILANLKEPALEQTIEQPVNTIEEAHRFCGTIDYLNRREKIKQDLIDAGVFVLDVTPQQLAINLCNRYLDVKKSGYL